MHAGLWNEWGTGADSTHLRTTTQEQSCLLLREAEVRGGAVPPLPAGIAFAAAVDEARVVNAGTNRAGLRAVADDCRSTSCRHAEVHCIVAAVAPPSSAISALLVQEVGTVSAHKATFPKALAAASVARVAGAKAAGNGTVTSNLLTVHFRVFIVSR